MSGMPSRFQGVPKDKQCKPFKSLTTVVEVDSIGRDRTTTVMTTVVEAVNPANGLGLVFEGVEEVRFVVPLEKSLGITAGSKFKVTIEIINDEKEGAGGSDADSQVQ